MRYDAPRHPPTSHPTLSTPSLSRPTAPDWGPPARTATVLVETGMLRVTQGGRHLRYLEAGDYFGEVALLSERPRTATVAAVGPLRAYRLPGEGFRRLLAAGGERALVAGTSRYADLRG